MAAKNAPEKSLSWIVLLLLSPKIYRPKRRLVAVTPSMVLLELDAISMPLPDFSAPARER
jgi:hypothetical protein